MKKYVAVAVAVMLSGCSATSLRCGTDGESSYVHLDNFDEIAISGRYYAEVCAFNYQAGDE